MAQHLRIGSVVNYGTTYINAVVSNITDTYLELEIPLSGGGTEVRALPWAALTSSVVVVTD